MVYFRSIEPTAHYAEEHAEEVPWGQVVAVILSTKCYRKNGNKFEIQERGYYILFKVKDKVLYVINAKRC